MVADKIFIVTGGNRGIGLETVRQLIAHPHAHIYLTSRNVEAGQAAAKEINASSTVHVLPLDLSSSDSIKAFAETLRKEHGENSIDVLINNAGFYNADDKSKAPDIIAVNLGGTKELITAMLPLMRKGTPGEAGSGGRIINVSSRGGMYKSLEDGAVKSFFANPTTMEAINTHVDAFVQEAASNDHPTWGGLHKLTQASYPFLFYKVSKLALNAMTRLWGPQLEAEYGMSMSALCPGVVKTDMTIQTTRSMPNFEELLKKEGFEMKPLEQGAETSVWLATVPYAEVKQNGKFYGEKREISFDDGHYLN